VSQNKPELTKNMLEMRPYSYKRIYSNERSQVWKIL
jgi:hypothetical protein